MGGSIAREGLEGAAALLPECPVLSDYALRRCAVCGMGFWRRRWWRWGGDGAGVGVALVLFLLTKAIQILFFVVLEKVTNYARLLAPQG
jgi:hypothetical protein